MKNLLVIVLFFALSCDAFAQDVIVKKDGSAILSKILEVNTSDIKYKKYSNLDGQVYTMQKSEILSINYENGEVLKVSSGDTGNVVKMKSASDETISMKNNKKWQDYVNDRTAIYNGPQENKMSKWQYRILKFHRDSKVADGNVYITYWVSNYIDLKFSGKNMLTRIYMFLFIISRII